MRTPAEGLNQHEHAIIATLAHPKSVPSPVKTTAVYGAEFAGLLEHNWELLGLGPTARSPSHDAPGSGNSQLAADR